MACKHVEPVLSPLEPGQMVLTRWQDDGWYYFGTVRGQGTGRGGRVAYTVEDHTGHTETTLRRYILTEHDQIFQSVKVQQGSIECIIIQI